MNSMKRKPARNPMPRHFQDSWRPEDKAMESAEDEYLKSHPQQGSVVQRGSLPRVSRSPKTL